MAGDFATSPSELYDSASYWDSEEGRALQTVIGILRRGRMPKPARESFKQALESSTIFNTISDPTDFSAARQVVQLINLLNKSLGYYMPGGVIDESKASASDIKNLLTTATNIVKLIHSIQKDLYTSDRLAATERAIHNTFNSLGDELQLPDDLVDEMRKIFRRKLEDAFDTL